MTDQSSSVRNFRASTMAVFSRKATKENLGKLAVALVGAGIIVIQGRVVRKMYTWYLQKYIQCPTYTLLLRGKIQGDVKAEITEDLVTLRYASNVRGGMEHESCIENYKEDGYDFIEKKGHNPKVVYNETDNTTFIKVNLTKI